MTTIIFPLGMFLYVGSTMFGTGLALLESQMLIPEQHNNLCFHFWWFLEVRMEVFWMHLLIIFRE